jgi:hypothetical protein
VGFLDMLLFVLHHLGDPLEVEFVKPGSFANSFLPHVLGSPNGSFKLEPYRSPPQCIIQVTLHSNRLVRVTSISSS